MVSFLFLFVFAFFFIVAFISVWYRKRFVLTSRRQDCLGTRLMRVALAVLVSLCPWRGALGVDFHDGVSPHRLGLS